MIRKTLKLGVLAALGGLLLFGTHLGSYVKTSAGWAKSAVKDSIPLEFEIERARQMSRDLAPEIRGNMQTIAREEVAIQQLQERVAKLESTTTRDRADLGKLQGDLNSGNSKFHYGGRTYTVSQVKNDLGTRLERCKTNDATLNSLRDMLAAREKGLEAARAKLDAMLVGKRQLEAEVENLEARLKMVQVAQTTSMQNLDDSQLGRVKELVSDLRSRLQVAEKLAHAEVAPIGEIPVSDTTSADVVDQVAEYLGTSSKHEQVSASE